MFYIYFLSKENAENFSESGNEAFKHDFQMKLQYVSCCKDAKKAGLPCSRKALLKFLF